MSVYFKITDKNENDNNYQYTDLNVVKFLCNQGLDTDDLTSKNNYAILNASKNRHSDVSHFLCDQLFDDDYDDEY
jgi:hypothetical protein